MWQNFYHLPQSMVRFSKKTNENILGPNLFALKLIQLSHLLSFATLLINRNNMGDNQDSQLSVSANKSTTSLSRYFHFLDVKVRSTIPKILLVKSNWVKRLGGRAKLEVSNSDVIRVFHTDTGLGWTGGWRWWRRRWGWTMKYILNRFL